MKKLRFKILTTFVSSLCIMLLVTTVNAAGGIKSVNYSNGYGKGRVSENALYSPNSPYWQYTGLTNTVTNVITGYSVNGTTATTAVRTKDKLTRKYTIKYLDRANYINVTGSGGSNTWYS